MFKMYRYECRFLTFIETSATRFLVFGSNNGGIGPNGGTPWIIRPNMTPSRSRCVSALVSISHKPGMPCVANQEPSERFARQWQARVLTSPTIKPAAQIRLDSNHLKIRNNNNILSSHLCTYLTAGFRMRCEIN